MSPGGKRIQPGPRLFGSTQDKIPLGFAKGLFKSPREKFLSVSSEKQTNNPGEVHIQVRLLGGHTRLPK